MQPRCNAHQLMQICAENVYCESPRVIEFWRKRNDCFGELLLDTPSTSAERVPSLTLDDIAEFASALAADIEDEVDVAYSFAVNTPAMVALAHKLEEAVQHGHSKAISSLFRAMLRLAESTNADTWWEMGSAAITREFIRIFSPFGLAVKVLQHFPDDREVTFNAICAMGAFVRDWREVLPPPKFVNLASSTLVRFRSDPDYVCFALYSIGYCLRLRLGLLQHCDMSELANIILEHVKDVRVARAVFIIGNACSSGVRVPGVVNVVETVCKTHPDDPEVVSLGMFAAAELCRSSFYPEMMEKLGELVPTLLANAFRYSWHIDVANSLIYSCSVLYSQRVYEASSKPYPAGDWLHGVLEDCLCMNVWSPAVWRHVGKLHTLNNPDFTAPSSPVSRFVLLAACTGCYGQAAAEECNFNALHRLVSSDYGLDAT